MDIDSEGEAVAWRVLKEVATVTATREDTAQTQLPPSCNLGEASRS